MSTYIHKKSIGMMYWKKAPCEIQYNISAISLALEWEQDEFEDSKDLFTVSRVHRPRDIWIFEGEQIFISPSIKGN
jgi:hypothetical protein